MTWSATDVSVGISIRNTKNTTVSARTQKINFFSEIRCMKKQATREALIVATIIARAIAGYIGKVDTGQFLLWSLVAMLIQTERFGTSLATALRVHADSMRIIRMQRAEERAQKATLKLILPSTMIFVALLMIFLAPGGYMLMNALGSN